MLPNPNPDPARLAMSSKCGQLKPVHPARLAMSGTCGPLKPVRPRNITPTDWVKPEPLPRVEGLDVGEGGEERECVMLSGTDSQMVEGLPGGTVIDSDMEDVLCNPGDVSDDDVVMHA